MACPPWSPCFTHRAFSPLPASPHFSHPQPWPLHSVPLVCDTVFVFLCLAASLSTTSSGSTQAVPWPIGRTCTGAPRRLHAFVVHGHAGRGPSAAVKVGVQHSVGILASPPSLCLCPQQRDGWVTWRCPLPHTLPSARYTLSSDRRAGTPRSGFGL